MSAGLTMATARQERQVLLNSRPCDQDSRHISLCEIFKHWPVQSTTRNQKRKLSRNELKTNQWAW